MRKLFLIHIIFLIVIGIYLPAKSQPFKTEELYKEYLLQNIGKTDFIEGIWMFYAKVALVKDYDASPKDELVPYRIAIIKLPVGNNYRCYEIDIFGRISEKSYTDYYFESTAFEGQYLYNYSWLKDYNCNGKATILSSGDLYFECKNKYQLSGTNFWDNLSITATKVAPTQAEIRNSKFEAGKKGEDLKAKFSYGTGVAVRNDLILTCYHVVEKAKLISIKGVNGRFDTTYSANINFYDPNLDIAILSIENYSANKDFALPYSLKRITSEVGENIFVLGYPLQNTMGQEIKLTTGVISSNSGFLGDTTLFQISAPIQPGNSGGPLFNNNGNLIGIVSSKHKNAENVGYAVKLNLFTDFLRGKGVSFIPNKTLPIEFSKKIKLFKKYIYPIEVTLK